MFNFRRSVVATLGLLALLSALLVQPIHSAPQRTFTSNVTHDVLFTDDFKRSSIGSDWESFNWSIWASDAWNSSGGCAPLQTVSAFSETGYVIETRALGFARPRVHRRATPSIWYLAGRILQDRTSTV